MKESEVILIARGGLTEDYESFVTSITTRFDHSMTFSSLCELLMDQKMRQLEKTLALGAVKIVAKSEFRSPEDKGEYQGKSKVIFQFVDATPTMQSIVIRD